MTSEPEEVLNLIRISDTFFPLGSFTVSQGMEQLVVEDLLPKEKITPVVQMYMDKIWTSFDFQIFHHSLEAAKREDLELLLKIDGLCYASKIAEESRTAMQKMGANLGSAVPFGEKTLGARYKGLIEKELTPGMYPVMLAVVSKELKLNEQGGISLMYVNLIEVIASLVRMAEIDYLEAQNVMSEGIRGIKLNVGSFADLNQSYPAIDIASMRHEVNPNRMFIS